MCWWNKSFLIVLMTAIMFNWNEIRDTILFPAPIVEILDHLKNERWVFVTGGTKGIGFEYCNQLVQRGYRCIFTGRKQETVDEALEKFEKQNPDKKGYFVGIILNMNDAKASLEIVKKTFEIRVPFMAIFNADNELVVPIAAISENVLMDLLQANVVTNTLLTQYFLKYWIKTNQKGIIFGLSSIGNPFPLVNAEAYSGSRAYQTRMWTLLQRYCESHYPNNVRVIVVETGVVLTETALKAPKETLDQLGPIAYEPKDYVKNVLMEGLDKRKRYIMLGFSFNFGLFLQKFGLPIDFGEMLPFPKDYHLIQQEFLEETHPFKHVKLT